MQINSLRIPALLFITSSLLSGCAIMNSSEEAQLKKQKAESEILPSKLHVYVHGVEISQEPKEGYSKKSLPVVNTYKKSPGCYVMCYTHDPAAGVYQLGERLYTVGMLRGVGHYDGTTCVPYGYENKDISVEYGYRDMCAILFDKCKRSGCWGKGDTGQWVGLGH